MERVGSEGLALWGHFAIYSSIAVSVKYFHIELLDKLTILSDAAKYDAACTSSGVKRGARPGMIGNTSSSIAGRCHRTMRFVLYLALAITSLLAIVSASLALAGKRISSVLGIITAALALVCNVFGIATRYHGYTYPLKDGTYSGTLQLVGIILFTVIAVAFAVIITMSKKPASEPAAVEA